MPPIIRKLFFGFLMRSLLAAPLAKFLQFYLALHLLFVLARPIVYALADRTLEFY